LHFINLKIAQGMRRPAVHLTTDKMPSQEQQKFMPQNIRFTI